MARLFRVLLQLDAQRSDEVVHRARRALVLGAPAAREDIVAAQGAAARLEEEPQHLELLRAHLDGFPRALDRLPIEIHLDAAEARDRSLVRRRRPASQESLDPRQQLAEPERLR